MSDFRFSKLCRLVTSSRVRASRRSRAAWSVESFEVRLLPSGNVVATVVDGTLTLNGDAKDNSVRVEISSGNVVVTGLDGTTINGDPDFEAVTGSTTLTGDVVARLGGGDDQLVFGDDLVIEGSVRVTDRLGASTLGMRSVKINGGLLVQTGRASDAISLVDTTIGGDARMATHAGKDLVSLSQTTVTGTLEVVTGSGKDGVVIDDGTLSSSARVRTGGGTDGALIRQTTIAGDLSARTGRRPDFLMFENSTVEGKSRVLMGQGGDSLVTQDTNEFKQSAVFRGQRGRRDAIDLSADTTFDAGKVVKGFHKQTVDASLIDSVLNDPDTGLLTLTTALQAEIDDLLS